jgi:hypothetical protein
MRISGALVALAESLSALYIMSGAISTIKTENHGQWTAGGANPAKVLAVIARPLGGMTYDAGCGRSAVDAPRRTGVLPNRGEVVRVGGVLVALAESLDALYIMSGATPRPSRTHRNWWPGGLVARLTFAETHPSRECSRFPFSPFDCVFLG